jgi:hypothetical protein
MIQEPNGSFSRHNFALGYHRVLQSHVILNILYFQKMINFFEPYYEQQIACHFVHEQNLYIMKEP